MPIDIDRFERLDEVPVRPGTNKAAVLEFLAAHPDQAYRPSEVAAETGVNPNSVGTVLARLEAADLVRGRGGYWTVAETDPVAAFIEELREAGEAAEHLVSEEVERLLARIRRR